MSLHTPNDFLMRPCCCHVCGKEITEQEHAVEHSGRGQYMPRNVRGVKEEFVTIWLHPECATVLMLRLANDVMRVSHKSTTPRVVDTLQRAVKQRKENEHQT
jgi:hypothetical protein